MNQLAEMFDSPLDSPEHIQLRSEGWLGGPSVEGRYLLGRLLQRNFFKESDADFLSAMHDHLAKAAGPIGAKILMDDLDIGVIILKHQCRRFADIPPPSKPKVLDAYWAIVTNPTLSDVQIAEQIGTTVKTVGQMSYLGRFRHRSKEQI